MLLEALDISPNTAQRIAICGAGGKTTLMYALTREAAARGIKSGFYTTTHIMQPEGEDLMICTQIPGAEELQALKQGKIIAAGQISPHGKWKQPEDECLSWLDKHCDFLVAEADGSKRLPLKYPGHWEPVIPENSSKIIVVCGLSCLDKPLSKICYRWQLACEEQGFDHTIADERAIADILAAGYGRHQPLILLNQADTPQIQQRANTICQMLAEKGIQSRIASLQQNLIIAPAI